MDVSVIGRQIAELRKEKGLKQETLASAMGVTAQAVSKWENGGVPDLALLPAIADFFEVSIDALFAHASENQADLGRSVAMTVANTAPHQRPPLVMELCWEMERALFGLQREKTTLKEFCERLPPQEQEYSGWTTNAGFTRMGVGNRLQYFFMLPEMKDPHAALMEGIDYPAFFSLLADPDTFAACVWLHSRDKNTAFTSSLLAERLDIPVEKAKQIVRALEDFNLVQPFSLEGTDGISTAYRFQPTTAFVALLVFAREMIDRPHLFCYHGDNRTKPML